MSWDLHHAFWEALAAALVVVAAGWAVQRWLIPLLARIASRTHWSIDDALTRALHGMPLFWSVLIAVRLIMAHARSASRTVVDTVLLVAFIWSLCVALNRLVGALIDKQVQGRAARTGGSRSIIGNLTALIVYLLGGLVVLQQLGISITPLLTALGVGGLAVALALQPTLGNLFSGLQLIASHQVNNGDYVKLASGEEGYVVDITWRNTILRALPNNIVVIPNAQLASAIISNYHLPDREISVGVDVGVAYGSDLELVERVTVETARSVTQRLEPTLSGFEPSVRFNAMGPSAVQFSVGLRASEFTRQYLLKHVFIKELLHAYAHHGISIPFPTRTVQLEHLDPTRPA